jgi:hypothetical protein
LPFHSSNTVFNIIHIQTNKQTKRQTYIEIDSVKTFSISLSLFLCAFTFVVTEFFMNS